MNGICSNHWLTIQTHHILTELNCSWNPSTSSNARVFASDIIKVVSSSIDSIVISDCLYRLLVVLMPHGCHHKKVWLSTIQIVTKGIFLLCKVLAKLLICQSFICFSDLSVIVYGLILVCLLWTLSIINQLLVRTCMRQLLLQLLTTLYVLHLLI